MPIWNAYHDQGLHIVAYALESDAAIWKAAAEKDGADRWSQASDLQGDDAAFFCPMRVKQKKCALRLIKGAAPSGVTTFANNAEAALKILITACSG